MPAIVRSVRFAAADEVKSREQPRRVRPVRARHAHLARVEMPIRGNMLPAHGSGQREKHILVMIVAVRYRPVVIQLRRKCGDAEPTKNARSEEHTSELQSPMYLV